MVAALAIGRRARHVPASCCRPTPTASIIGSVPSQKTAIRVAPCHGVPVPAAVTTNA